jgi:hypothetical protein
MDGRLVVRLNGVLALGIAAAVGGCASQATYLQSIEPAAMTAATNRGKFELNSPDVTGTVLSSKIIQPVVFGGIERAEYTIGVRGCGKEAVYVTICPDKDDCNALAQTGRLIDDVE